MKYDRAIFDSIYELGEHVQHLESHDTRKQGTSSTDKGDQSFYGYWSMTQAVQTALDGGAWHEGAEAMPTLTVPHETLSGHPLDGPELVSDIAGFCPNVPAYLSGQPDSMFNLIEAPTSERLIKVAVHVGRIYTTKQHHALNRGAAIMAVLDQLSREGYSIELWALWRNEDGGPIGASVETKIKGSTDFWSPESVAFALAHVAFQRRLCWRVCESMTGGGADITSGYGNGSDATYEGFDMSFAYLKHPSDYETPEGANEIVKAEALAQLNARDLAA